MYHTISYRIVSYHSITLNYIKYHLLLSPIVSYSIKTYIVIFDQIQFFKHVSYSNTHEGPHLPPAFVPVLFPSPAPSAILAPGGQQGPCPWGRSPASCEEIDESEDPWRLWRGLRGGRRGGQAPSNTKQAELMASLWRKRRGRKGGRGVRVYRWIWSVDWLTDIWDIWKLEAQKQIEIWSK